MNIKALLLLGLIVLLGAVLRLLWLGDVPPGLSIDEASLSYDAYSLYLTGKDQYGESFPIFLRSFATYQSPLYTYLAILPVALMGLSAGAVRLVSVVASILILVFTFSLLRQLKTEASGKLALVGSLLLSISPWAIFVGRMAVEANIALMLMVLVVWLAILALRRPKLIWLVGAVLGIATYAYHGQRLLSGLFLFGYLLIFRKSFAKHKKWVVVALAAFILFLVPQLLIVTSTGSLRRFEQTNYLDNLFFQKNGGDLRNVPLGHEIFIIREFTTQYLEYFSFRNLFFDPDPQRERSIPDLSVFYNWMIIPLLLGIRYLIANRSVPGIKVLLLLLAVSPIPAGLTRDPFYTLRALPLFWALSIVISFGFYDLLAKVRWQWAKIAVSLVLIIWSICIFYVNYFIFFRYERSDYTFGFPFAQLVQKTEEMKDKTFVVDYTAQPASYVWIALYKQYDPKLLQAELRKKVKLGYYQDSYFDPNTKIGNIEVRQIIWGEVCNKKVIIGDISAIPDEEVNIRQFKLVEEFKDLRGKTILRAYTSGKQCI